MWHAECGRRDRELRSCLSDCALPREHSDLRVDRYSQDDRSDHRERISLFQRLLLHVGVRTIDEVDSLDRASQGAVVPFGSRNRTS